MSSQKPRLSPGLDAIKFVALALNRLSFVRVGFGHCVHFPKPGSLVQ